MNVKDLLENWGLSELTATFEEHNITTYMFGKLQNKILKELIPNIGTRIKFTRQLNICNATIQIEFENAANRTAVESDDTVSISTISNASSSSSFKTLADKSDFDVEADDCSLEGRKKFYLHQSKIGTLLKYITKRMQIVNNCVLLLKAEKSEESEDKYEVMLTQQGFTVIHLKTLEFTYRILDQLKQKLDNPHLYSGVIFTTPRSVKAVKEALGKSCINIEWNEKTNYVVGETTHSIVLNELGLNCNGQESGNANNLADIILEDKIKISKPLLFPCGNLKTDTLVNRLKDKEVEVEAVTVYDTIPSSSLDQDFSDLTSNFTSIPEYFVYFSPSGVQNTIKYVKKFDTQLNLIKFIAIGPTTENALKNNNIQVKAVAVKPTPNDVLCAILD